MKTGSEWRWLRSLLPALPPAGTGGSPTSCVSSGPSTGTALAEGAKRSPDLGRVRRASGSAYTRTFVTRIWPSTESFAFMDELSPRAVTLVSRSEPVFQWLHELTEDAHGSQDVPRCEEGSRRMCWRKHVLQTVFTSIQHGEGCHRRDALPTQFLHQEHVDNCSSDRYWKPR